MFTVRVNRTGGHDVFMCAKYRVKYDRVSPLRLELLGVVGQDGDETVTFANGDRAFVMNECGETVDQITPSKVPQ